LIVGFYWGAWVNHSFEGGWSTLIGLLCFLPMCFFFVGAGTSQLYREIKELRKQIEKLRQQNYPDSK
jgi:hypothetical protein